MAATFWQSLWWSYFASLPEDRICYRTIQKHKVASILEIGIEDGVRAERMIQMAIRNAGPRVVSYVGIDLFEAHPDSDGDSLTLKQAHQQFTALGARVKLVPGEAFPALDRIANWNNFYGRAGVYQFQCVIASGQSQQGEDPGDGEDHEGEHLGGEGPAVGDGGDSPAGHPIPTEVSEVTQHPAEDQRENYCHTC